MNLKAASRELDVHYQTAYKWVRSGVLQAVRVGGRYEVSEAAIAQFRATRQSFAAVPAAPVRCAPPSELSREDVLEELEAMATDPVIACTSVVSFAARRAREVVGDGCMVVLMNADRRHIDSSALSHESPARTAVLSAALGLVGAPPVMGINAVSQAYFNGYPIRVPHVPQDAMRLALVPELRQYLVQYPVHSLMAAPIMAAGEPVGFVAFARDTATHPYSADDEAYMVRLADRIGALVQVTREITMAWRERAEIVAEMREKMTRGGLGYVPTLEDAHDVVAARSQSPFLIAIFDTESRIIAANRTFTEATGYDEADLRAMPTFGFVSPDERDCEIANITRLVSGELDYHDLHGHSGLADGSEIFIAAHRAAVRGLDATLGCIVSVARVVVPFSDAAATTAWGSAYEPAVGESRTHAA